MKVLNVIIILLSLGFCWILLYANRKKGGDNTGRRSGNGRRNTVTSDKEIEGDKKLIEGCPDSVEAGFAKKKLPIAEFEMKKKESGQKEEEIATEIEKPHRAGIQLTTANAFEGYKVAKTLGVVSGQSATVMDVHSGAFAKNGGNTEELLRKTRIACLKKLRKNAAAIGANAVIAIRLSRNETYGGKSILSISAYGTAVLVDKNRMAYVS
ncbi:MAG: heavy metal-binding domain-containing protein [Thermodesulfobacteriota bacterium]